MTGARRVRDLGEQGLLQLLQRFCPAGVVGDDAALLPVAAGHTLVVTTDMLVDGVHFSDRTTAPADVGWRAAAANLSDLAAMGATPLGITVALGLPGETQVEWVEQLYQGMAECLRLFETAIVGGDICRSPGVTVAIAAFGQVLPQQAIRRGNARPGDAILVTGVHGASRAGLELLLHPELGSALATADRASLIQAHQRPKPRLDVLPKLWQALNQVGEQGISVAGMDSSDGLADAVLQLCRASGTGAELERSWIPIPPALMSIVSEPEALNWALYGGEDFELVLCLPPEAAHLLQKELGEGAAIVGSITAEATVVLKDASGKQAEDVLSLDRGFQHF